MLKLGHGFALLVERLYRPAQLLVGVGLMLAFTQWLDDERFTAFEAGLADGVIIAAIWMGLVVSLWLVAVIGGLATFAGSDAARRFRSQVDTLTRVLSLVVAAAVVLAALIHVTAARDFGVVMLTAGGLIGAVAGLAATQTLSHAIAGVAIGFNDKLNIGDVIEIDGESGEIIERTLTYVTLKLSGQRTLALPSAQLLGKSYKVWKLTRHNVVGWVPLTVDWGVSVDGLRTRLREVHPDTYGPTDDLRVEMTGTTDTAVQVRAMVRATPDDLWDVQCAVRDELVSWIHQHATTPQLRAAVTMPPAQNAGTSAGTNAGTSAGTNAGASSRTTARTTQKPRQRKAPGAVGDAGAGSRSSS